MSTEPSSSSTLIREIGEFGLIERMRRILGEPSDPQVLAGVSDDAAVYRVDDDRGHVMTTDVLIEGVHFDRLIMPMEYLGMKAIAVNVSDVVAMNARPRYATVGLGIPGSVSVEDIEGCYRGMKKACDLYGMTLVGGDTSAAHWLTLSATVIGEAPLSEIVYRGGAIAEDLLCVTGPLGGAYAGLKVLLDQRRELHERKEAFTPNLGHHRYVIRRQLIPQARLDVVDDWADRGARPNALIDVSDGIGSDLHHLCRASGCGAELYAAALPIAPEARLVADAFREDVDTYALFGGEDYELLFAAPRETIDRMDPSTFNVIGRFTVGEDVVLWTSDGSAVPLGQNGRGGYEHFREGEPSPDSLP